jgi:Nif-specific regulatory protein
MASSKFSNDLLIIYKISQSLLRHKNVNTLLNEVLDILETEMNTERATLTLFHINENALIIEASKGLSAQEKARGRYSLGEGVTGLVGLNRQAIVIPNIAEEESFLDRTRARKRHDIGFVCVPVMRNDELIGTISVDLEATPDIDWERKKQLLEIIANLLADAIFQIREGIEEKNTLKTENSRLQKELGNRYNPSNMVGNSRVMQKVFENINLMGNKHGSILIMGESGVGKELTSRAIHFSGIRKMSTFLSLNCSGLPINMVEKELFGVERDGRLIKAGMLEKAHGGTLYIDELTDTSMDIQHQLEDYLQNQTFKRVGGTETLNSNVRLIVGTYKNVDEAIENEEISESFYYRLSVNTLVVPPLRDRKSDITLLADFFLDEFNRSYGKKVVRISTPAINMIMAYHWPGNVLELKNCVERAVLSTDDDVIHGYNLPPSLQAAGLNEDDPDNNTVTDLQASLETYERELLVEALKRHRGNAAAAARALNTTPRVLNYKFNKLNINLKDFKKSSSNRF